MAVWRNRTRSCATLLAAQAVAIAIIAALSYLLLGWEGLAAKERTAAPAGPAGMLIVRPLPTALTPVRHTS
jgi:hypothetical protein